MWEARFATLVGAPPRIRHRLFGWDIPATREADDRAFLHAGYMREDTAVMSATQLHRPEPRTAPVDLRVLPDTDEVWAAVVDEQVACLDPRTGEPEAEYRTFKEGQFRRYRAMVRAGLGSWYGAFVDGRLAANLGVFTDGAGLLRFQAVNTHPDFRRRGLCGALTHFAGTHAQGVFGGHQLVIVADDHDVAKGIYERVGFRVVERQRLLLKRPPTS